MVEVFNENISSKRKRNSKAKINITVIPQLTKANEISLSRGDTLLVEINTEDFDLYMVPHILEAFEKQFPNNAIMILPNHIKVERVKE